MVEARLVTDVDIACSAWREMVADADSLCARAASAAMHCAGGLSGPAEVSIKLADDAFVRDLNGRYRNQDSETNVLAFPQQGATPPGAPVLLGDIVVAAGVVRREAEAARRTVDDHLSHMIVHGMLHLMGHDHLNDDEAKTMEALEVQALADLEIANPYRDDGDDERP